MALPLRGHVAAWAPQNDKDAAELQARTDAASADGCEHLLQRVIGMHKDADVRAFLRFLVSVMYSANAQIPEFGEGNWFALPLEARKTA